ncbi:hypothetical protein D3C79_989480 [compost metagenome]
MLRGNGDRRIPSSIQQMLQLTELLAGIGWKLYELAFVYYNAIILHNRHLLQSLHLQLIAVIGILIDCKMKRESFL